MAEYDDDSVGLSSMMMEDAHYLDEQQQLEEQNRQMRLLEQREQAKMKLAARREQQNSVSGSRCQAVWHLETGSFTQLIRQPNSLPAYGCTNEAVGKSKYWNGKMEDSPIGFVPIM